MQSEYTLGALWGVMLNRDHPKEWLSSEFKISLIPLFLFLMNPDYPIDTNSNKIRSINTLNDLITILNQVRDKVGGNVKVMGAEDTRDARCEDSCYNIEDVVMYGMESMMNKHDSEDTRVVIIF